MGLVIRASDSGALNGIRQLISVYLTPQSLPNSIIDSDIFLEAAERQVFQALGITSNTDYLTRAGLPTDFQDFPRNQFPKLINYRGNWMSANQYAINDIISFRNTPTDPWNLYIATMDSQNVQPNTGSANWNKISVTFKGSYQGGVSYQKDDITEDSNRLYYANSNIQSAIAAINTSEWTRIQSVNQSPDQKAFEERVKRAVQLQAAIRLIPAVPQLVEEQILRERVRYQAIDWDQRLSIYQTETDDTLQPDAPGIVYASGTAIFGEVKQRVAF